MSKLNCSDGTNEVKERFINVHVCLGTSHDKLGTETTGKIFCLLLCDLVVGTITLVTNKNDWDMLIVLGLQDLGVQVIHLLKCNTGCH